MSLSDQALYIIMIVTYKVISVPKRTGEVPLPVLQMMRLQYYTGKASGRCQTGCGEEGSTLTISASYLLDSG